MGNIIKSSKVEKKPNLYTNELDILKSNIQSELDIIDIQMINDDNIINDNIMIIYDNNCSSSKRFIKLIDRTDLIRLSY